MDLKLILVAGGLAAGLALGGGGTKFWYDRVVVPDRIPASYI